MTQPLNHPPGARRGRREGRQPNIRDTVRSIGGTPAERAADSGLSLPSGARLVEASRPAGRAAPAQQVEQFGRSATGEAVRGTFMLGGAAAGFKTGDAGRARFWRGLSTIRCAMIPTGRKRAREPI